MTDGYRVDEAITPKLHRLGQLLTRVLRLPQPLDLFIWASEEKNAYCLPSRKGNRLIMCLYSGLVASLSSQELLFIMGHEVGHALLNHGQTLGVAFDNPDFSPVEVVRLRALDRAQEVSCDRFGLSGVPGRSRRVNRAVQGCVGAHGIAQERPTDSRQAKRLAVCAIKVCRDMQDNQGVARKGRGTPLDRQIQDHGIVAMFQRGEVVGFGPERQPMIVLSVSRAKGTLVVASQGNLDAAEQVEPCDLAKDPINGSWPEDLGGG